jgi:hypothetical protein
MKMKIKVTKKKTLIIRKEAIKEAKMKKKMVIVRVKMRKMGLLF